MCVTHTPSSFTFHPLPILGGLGGRRHNISQEGRRRRKLEGVKGKKHVLYENDFGFKGPAQRWKTIPWNIWNIWRDQGGKIIVTKREEKRGGGGKTEIEMLRGLESFHRLSEMRGREKECFHFPQFPSIKFLLPLLTVTSVANWSVPNLLYFFLGMQIRVTSRSPPTEFLQKWLNLTNIHRLSITKHAKNFLRCSVGV